jgi:hypothetical protein
MSRPVLRIRILDPGSGAFLTPGSGMGKKSGSGSGIRIQDERPGSYFRELKKQFLGLKYLNSLMCIWDPGRKKLSDPGSGMEKSRIRDKHPGSAQRRDSRVQGADPHPFPSSTREKAGRKTIPLLPFGIDERYGHTILNLGHAALMRRCELPLSTKVLN